MVKNILTQNGTKKGEQGSYADKLKEKKHQSCVKVKEDKQK